MSNNFKLEIINPEKSFLVKDNVSEVVAPAFEGELGILKDHISIISFLRPGLLKVFDSSASEEIYYLEDGIIEFKNNCLSILTSNIFDIKSIDKNKVQDILSNAEKELKKQDISDQVKYLIDHKIEVLKSLN
mgnify:CR=1 FL=1|tara:strand:+ start:942 stop:1337 length:396 start_codon:yes stop_codon:yes gene_type:complete